MPRPSQAGPTVRWDRLGRIAMLAVLIALLYLYFGAARSLLSTYRDASHRRAEVARLNGENAALRRRRDALNSPVAVEREARLLGMIRPGERTYVIQGLPAH